MTPLFGTPPKLPRRGPCNKAIGLFEDDVERLQAAIDYLHGWKAVV